eukprot:7884394-Pyramimonas_sp.AAC.1
MISTGFTMPARRFKVAGSDLRIDEHDVWSFTSFKETQDAFPSKRVRSEGSSLVIASACIPTALANLNNLNALQKRYGRWLTITAYTQSCLYQVPKQSLFRDLRINAPPWVLPSVSPLFLQDAFDPYPLMVPETIQLAKLYR